VIEFYWNLHKRTFSVRDPKTRKVIGHQDEITMKSPSFRVSEAGRQRVLREKAKNVHAVVRGEEAWTDGRIGRDFLGRLTYDPYKSGEFGLEFGGVNFPVTSVGYIVATVVTIDDKRSPIILCFAGPPW